MKKINIIDALNNSREYILSKKNRMFSFFLLTILLSFCVSVGFSNYKLIKNNQINQSYEYATNLFNVSGYQITRKDNTYIFSGSDSFFQSRPINLVATSLELYARPISEDIDFLNVQIYYSNVKNPEIFSGRQLSGTVDHSGVATFYLPENTSLSTLRIYIGNLPNQEVLFDKIIVHSDFIWMSPLIFSIMLFIFLFAIIFLLTPFKVFDFLHTYRYALAFGFFMLLVIFEIHGSSIGMWSKYVESIPAQEGVLFGQSLPIRSDEWLAQTPMHFAQSVSKTPFSTINPNISYNGMDMVIATFAPTFDPLIILKPSLWGYILFGNAKGIAWFWNIRILLMLFTSYELLRILSKDKRSLSFLGAIILTLTPSLLWWESTSLVDAVYGLFGFSVAWYMYFYTDKLLLRILSAIAGAIFTGTFILCLYPPFLVPLAFLWISLMIFFFVKNFNKIKMMKFAKWIPLITSFFCVGALFIWFFLAHRNAIITLTNTIYPSANKFFGANYPDFLMSSFYLQPFISKTIFDLRVTNSCEFSTQLLPVFFPFIMIPFCWNRLEKGNRLLIVSLFFVLVVEMLWMVVGLPDLAASLLFLTKSSVTRTGTVAGITAMLLVILLLVSLDTKTHNKTELVSLRVFLAAIITLGIVIYGANNSTLFFAETMSLLGFSRVIVISFVFFAIMFLCFVYSKRSVALSLAILTCLAIYSGISINPVAKGVGALYSKPICQPIEKLKQTDPDALWVSTSSTGANFLITQGVHSINSVHYNPDIEFWKSIDAISGSDNSEIYNRYAHVTILLSNDDIAYTLNGADSFTVQISPEKLYKLGVKYVLGNENEGAENWNNVTLKTIYKSTVSDVSIYEIMPDQLEN